MINGIKAIIGLFLLLDSIVPSYAQSKNNADVRAVFAVFEGPKINVYSSNLDGSDRKLLISEQTEFTRSRPFEAIKATVSPAGDTIAYMTPVNQAHVPVFVVNRNGQRKRKILDKAENFYWTPDGEKIIFSLLPRGTPGKDRIGRSASAPGYEWYARNLETGKIDLIASPSDNFHSFGWWASVHHAIFMNPSLGELWLFLFDLNKRTTMPVKLIVGTRHFREISASPDRSRTVLILPDRGVNESCDVYELTSEWQLGSHLVGSPDYRCERLAWNGNDEIFYGKSTGPKGKISTREVSESGHYLLLSLYKYDFKTRKEEAVLKSTGKEVYRLLGVLNGNGLVVSNESSARTPRYILELRKLDGTGPVVLFSSENEMLFIGWLRM